ncbi:MAG: hypothetical protein WC369_07180 [Dehalococcoidales bacterium]|jgi:hypothetical protein
MLIWVRVGDDGAHESFTDLDDACNYLNDLGVGTPVGWLSNGFETEIFWGQDYVWMYWGTGLGSFVHELSPCEQAYVNGELLYGRD